MSSSAAATVREDDPESGNLAYSLSFANGNDFSSLQMNEMLNEQMKAQLEMCAHQRLLRDFEEEEQLLSSQWNHNNIATDWSGETTSFTSPDSVSLPRTMEDALGFSGKAVVVTETSSPFKVVHVNEAWQGLCGYSLDQAVGKTLGSLLGGPDTDRGAATALVSELLRGTEEAGTVLTNYKADGTRFRNRIRVGPLSDGKGGNVTHFVGVLREVWDGK
eukprot:CAMPEP_0183318576 /NCGR_PEP_ID=MMETSP0160_2-20130417/61146_1 /TAXON_ID=2839 ORGANISM="Odontella Sinensis, Strain Grunow 1884" /NCGR_SAMPLE_ID=MMETSP0160_2 /ASSEMBLY_ACC=CAM_ASM_000250 /LENGTH=217 /DNA_ID=CAMNT_0025484881 /DNA_START=195 /DNA_END=848 /DNA_ORIENTATION=-